MAGDRKRFLLVPAGGDGEGMGHLKRCLWLAGELGASCSISTEHLGAAARKYLQDVAGRMPGGPSFVIRDRLKARERWDIVVLDKRETSAREFADLSRRGCVVGLDEGGEARGASAYLIDTLPKPGKREPANVSSLGFLNLPVRRRRRTMFPFRNILVSFGGGDPADLSGRLIEAASRARLFQEKALSVVQGPFFKRTDWPRDVKVLSGVENLADELPNYDLLLTHFGMAALEAMAAGIPVILFNPTSYHRALGRLLGIPDIGVGKPDVPALRALMRNPIPLADAVKRFNAALRKQRGETLAGHLGSLAPDGSGLCPSCGGAGSLAAGRFPQRTFFRCPGCGILFQRSFTGEAKSYRRRYFFQEYKKQYGRTYLQDFEWIKIAGLRRAATIRGMLRDASSATIVDVGCAFGPFLSALKDNGFRPFGVDVSPEAVRYVRERLGIHAVAADFGSLRRSSLPAGEIKGITLWYVMEHFRDLGGALRKAASLLSPGGVLAFSTPNARGVSARKDLRSFLRESPADHYTILSPKEIPGLLARHGFSLKAVLVTGHHPERFPGILGRTARASAPAKRALEAASRLFGLGDTFEAYAVKERI